MASPISENISREKLFTVLKEAYEQIVEFGQRGFCLVDEDGKIIHANQEMKKLIGPGELEGKYLTEFFCADDRDSIRQAFVERKPLLRLLITTLEKKSVLAGVDIGPLHLEGGQRWAYAFLTDLTEQKKREEEIYNKFPDGIIKWKLPTSPESYEQTSILYANAKASEIAGYKSLACMKLIDLFPDEKNITEMRAQIAKRLAGESDEYRVDLTRADGRQVPVMLSSVPEMDLHHKKVIASISIIRSLERQQAINSLHDVIETQRSSEDIFEGIVEVLKNVIPFDHLEVAIYSPDLQYARRLFPGPDVEPNWQTRWYKLSPKVIEWVKSNMDIEFINFRELIEKYVPELIGSEQYKPYEQYNYLLRYPVNLEEKTVAIINFYSKNDQYSTNHKDLLEALPLDNAVLLSLHYEYRDNLEFKQHLIRDLTLVCHDIPSIYRTLLKHLFSHYKWQSVALFEVDEKSGKIRLLDQQYSDPSWKLEDDFTQDLSGKGILAYVARNKRPKNIYDVATDPVAKEHYVADLKKTKSELCLPIKSGFGFWLLNIEDSRRNAFSPEEEKVLTEEILPELESFLERLSQHTMACYIQDSTSDMVIVTDNFNSIKKVNPATTEKLGYAESELINQPFQKLFANPDSYPDLLENQESIDIPDFLFKNKSGNHLKVLLSGSSFPKGINGKFYLAKDITIYDHEKDISYLNEHLDAMAARTSLSLASCWLNAITGLAPDLVEKIRKQLRRVEMTFDQFALYGRSIELPPEKIPLEVSEILANLEDQLPRSEYEKISIEVSPPKLMLRGDPFQILLCLQSILSYLMRYVPEDKKISLRVGPDGNNLTFVISGFWPKPDTDRHLSRTLFEMALGKKAIDQLMANHGGEFDYIPDNSRITF
ncbi:MAG TPA: PAS domain-containing protein, partial [Syntrophales bacterium]|nr:PAS domain-containing protein [Syntrophales bacterium]